MPRAPLPSLLKVLLTVPLTSQMPTQMPTQMPSKMTSLLPSLLLAALVAVPLIERRPAEAAGGNGASYCSNATGPQSGAQPFPAGPYGTFSNPGQVVSNLVGLLWGPGVGAPAREPGLFTRTVCNPSR